MNTFSTIIAFILLTITNVFSQVDTVDFSKFKMPDIKRKELIFNMDFSNINSFNQIKDTSFISEKNSDFYLFNSFDVNYRSYKNNRKYQGAHQFLINSFYQLKSKVDLSDSLIGKNKYIYSYTYFNGNNRIYLNKKHFFELNYELSYSNSFNKTIISNSGVDQFSDYYSYHSYSLNPSFAIGTGRIEPVTDVVHAIVYLKSFRKENRLKNDLSEESIFKFAEILAKSKNERFFDSRKKKIYELEKIDSFLITNNYITNSDIKYFSVLDDIWEYAGNFPRFSGRRMSLNLSPDYYVSFYDDLSTDTSEILISRKLNTTPYFSFVISKPINNIVQRDLYANLGYRYSTLVLTRDSTYKGASQWFLNLGLSYGFYPNTRTYLETSINLLYSRIITGKENEMSGNFGLKTYYYINPRLRVFMESDVIFDYESFLAPTESDKYFRSIINAGIQFAFF